MDYKRKEYNLILKPWITKEKSITLKANLDYKRKEYNLILKPWITKEKSITLF